MNASLRERCDMFVRCLPQAPMRDMLARLFGDLLADQWRPIESAPKDGRWIVGIGHLWLPEVPDTLQWRDEWRGGAWSNGCSEEDHQPTHWMPLPAAPHHRSADTERHGSDKPESDSGSSIAAQGMAQDAARYRWLTEDHADPQEREFQREVLRRLRFLSYSAACSAIDTAIAALRAVPHQPTGERNGE